MTATLQRVAVCFILVTIWQLAQNFFVNVIPTERSDEGSLKQHTRYLPSGRYDTNAGYYSFGSTPISLPLFLMYDVRKYSAIIL